MATSSDIQFEQSAATNSWSASPHSCRAKSLVSSCSELTVVICVCLETLLEGSVEVFDQNGRHIGHVDPVHVRSHPLGETRQVDERKREDWLRALARRSASEEWLLTQIEQTVHQEVMCSSHLQTPRSRQEANRQGRLAADPDVRIDFDRLVRLRDECWTADPRFFRRTRHGKSQLLIDILMRQKEPARRSDVVSPHAYLTVVGQRSVA